MRLDLVHLQPEKSMKSLGVENRRSCNLKTTAVISGKPQELIAEWSVCIQDSARDSLCVLLSSPHDSPKKAILIISSLQ